MKRFISKLLSRVFVPMQREVSRAMRTEKSIEYKGYSLTLLMPNKLSKYRVETFASKEPDTLDWIDDMPKRAILWDIGANVGLYSVYAAIARECQVYAFEPSVFNLEVLARNIYINRLQDSITIVPLALSDKTGVNMFRMSNTAWGGALSSFGESYDQNGMQFREVFEYRTLGHSMDQMQEYFFLPLPDFIKIDVDGIEHLILRGGARILKHVKGVLVEVNDRFIEQSVEVEEHLSSAGLRLLKKCDLGATGQFNQLWIREEKGV